MSEPTEPKEKEAKVRPFAYLSFLPGLVRLARTHGYALAVHGSLNTDFDLIAVPWVEKASDARELAEAIRSACGGVFCSKDHPSRVFEEKAHGRRAWAIHLAAEDLYVDLSVMPKVMW